ncbi:hypothetical protein B0H19DRAFT_1231737 [Mycena capillaripes]|nr:hypothetical protein B0H19DRAFT_1231737 [Mycena capillaripes]
MDSAVSFNVNTTIGAFQIGVLVSYVLFGVTTTQTYIYYSRFPEDSRKLKALVGFVWLCELGHTLCTGHTLYVYTISDYMHPELLLGAAPKSFETISMFAGFIASCVQSFFCYRIYCLSKKVFIPIIIWAMVSFRLVGSIVLFFAGLEMESLTQYVTQWEWLATSIWSVSVASDLMITATLVILLRNQRTDVQRTTALVDKIILWTIETGMLTSASSIITLGCFVAWKTTFIWTAVWFVNVRLFSNSLLASLNSRATLRAMNEVSMPSVHLSTALALSSSLNVQITKTTQKAYDGEPALVQCDKAVSEDPDA